jgi:hypothetical protein
MTNINSAVRIVNDPSRTFKKPLDRRLFVHLAYMDDSGTNDKKRRHQLLTAVIIEGVKFAYAESSMSVSLEALLPPEQLSEFSEFHAYELFGGEGIFKNVEQKQRFAVIEQLLIFLVNADIPIIYAVADKEKLAQTPNGSAHPIGCVFPKLHDRY